MFKEKVIDIGIYRLDIDAAQTAGFYSHAEGIGCDCDGCRNFGRAVQFLPPPVREFLRQFGIDPQKPAEVYVNYAPSQDTVSYGGFYHACGTILRGTDPWIQIDKNHFRLDQQYRIDLCDDFSVFITDQIDLPEDDFPAPVLQIEIEFILPWVLKEPNPYT